MLRPRKYKDLEKRLGYKFKTEASLTRALTHSSARSGKKSQGDNERLEFVGDRVLGLAISKMLSDKFPDANEGELARRFNRLVRGETCAKVGRTLDLGSHLILSDSEAGSGGRRKDTIIADAIEAVLGAIFLEAGFDKARDVVLRLWQDESLEQQPSVSVDAKSALQEWSQGQGMDLPRYSEVERKGPDHAPVFVSEVRIKGREPARGEGTSKRIAEQAAASAFLRREGVNRNILDE